LTSINIPDSVFRVGDYAFHRCSSLTSIHIGNSVTLIGSGAFSVCTKLEHVVFGRSLKGIGNGAFYNNALRTVEFPFGIKTIGSSAFQISQHLSSVVIPSSLAAIGPNAFAFSPVLRNVTIGDSYGVIIQYHAFSFCPKLEIVTIMSTTVTVFGDLFVGNENFILRFSRNAENIDGLSTDLGVICLKDTSSDSQPAICGCNKGFENLLPDSSPLFSCTACPKGTSNSIIASQGLCDICGPGRYAPLTGLESCEQYARGKFGTDYFAVSESTCRNCSSGKYAPVLGSSKCLTCPSGSACPSNGTSEYALCDLGTYNSYAGKEHCLSCPTGTYGPFEGAAICEDCQRGKYYGGTGATSASSCVDCPVGRFGGGVGLANCTVCPTGQYQPEEGQQMCLECTDIGTYKTSNQAHTGCIDNEDLLGKSVVELFFEGNASLAYAVSFSMSVFFVAICGVMHCLRKKYEHSSNSSDDRSLGNISLWEMIVKAGMPGLSFGSEVVSMMLIFMERPQLATVMLLFRLSHIPTTVFVVISLLGSKAIVSFISKVLPDAANWRSAFNDDFARKNIPIVGMVLLLCCCDVSLVQMLPWKRTAFYTASNGFPSKSIMRLALGVDTIQAGVSAICTIIYVGSEMTANKNDPATGSEARIFLALSISMSLITLSMGIVLLLLKELLLEKKPAITEEAEATPPLEEPIGETITTFDHSESRRSSAILELGNVYNASGAESMGQFSNPLHYDMKDKAATVSAKDLSRDDQLHRDRDEWAKERESLNEKIQELALRCGALQRRNEELVRTTQGESSSTTSASSPTVGYGAGSGEEGFHKDGVMAEDIIGDCL
tara:strand:+ start:183 stop:2684 length:2502 start_codon:yes stop_codon:yes gene_type:complete